MLYNKWRPAVLSDIRGQPHITQTLLSQLKSGRLAHAYLFTGSRGTGKTTCAKILARAVNCLRRDAADGAEPWDGEPCNQCVSCAGILAGSVPDVTEIDAASNSGVDNIRALREELIYSPVSSRKRVYIIDEVHMLSIGAFNALLKTLEEPPEHVLFILATTETHKVPATIVSRCQRFAFRRISADAIEDRLGQICEDEDIDIEKEGLALLSQMADGSLRDALSLLDQCARESAGTLTEASVRETLGLTGLGQLALWLREMDDLQKSIGHLNALYQAGMDVAAILGQLSALLRDLLMGQMLGDVSVTRLPEEEAKALSALWPRERIIRALTGITETRLSRSGNKKLEAELCLIKLAAPGAELLGTDPPPPAPATKPATAPAPVPVPPPAPSPVPERPPKAEPKPVKAERKALRPADGDPRWAKLLESVDNAFLRDALSQSGAQVDGDRLVIENADPFIQGVIKQANTQIKALFPGGTGDGEGKANEALDALIASAPGLVIEE
ncbi:MAG: DNA polymerase III subunit gamma/tau [Oscillospiraceae bacterium]|nr:DNA polymerase III subunit gamma/tau [Oscillospiraceae bacterium]